MTDTVKSWIEMRRTAVDSRKELGSGWTVDDAYAEFPRALNALEQVLELHQRKTAFDGELDYCGICVESEGASWPCSTAKAIEGAINHE